MNDIKVLKEPANGLVWAAMLAAAIGCAAIGVLTDLSEAFKPISNLLIFYAPAGDLSGKTTIGIVIWLAAWGILHARWKNREFARVGRIAAVTAIIFLIALVGTFPLFFGLFTAAENKAIREVSRLTGRFAQIE